MKRLWYGLLVFGLFHVVQALASGISGGSGGGGGPPFLGVYGVRQDSNGAAATPGSGYAVGDVITLNVSGCITRPSVVVYGLTVTGVNQFSVQIPGNCPNPPANPVGQFSTNGSGSGASFNLLWAPLAADVPGATFQPGGVNGATFYPPSLGAGVLTPAPGIICVGFGSCGTNGNAVDGMGGGTGITGAESTLLGYNTGTQLTSGQWNTYVGHHAGGHETTGNFNVAIGTDAEKWTVGASSSIAVGRNAGKFALNLTNDVLIGGQAGAGQQFIAAVSGAVNNGSGLCRLTVTTTGMGNGDTAVVTGITGASVCNGVWTNVAVVDGTHLDLTGSAFAGAYTSGGSVSDYSAVNVQRTVFIGENAGGAGTLRCVLCIETGIGNDALRALTTGTSDVAVGDSAGKLLTSGNQNVMVGTAAGSSGLVTGSGGVMIGYNANVTGDVGQAVIIGGTAAGGGAGARCGSGSVCIGARIGNASLTGANNVIIGFQIASTTCTTALNNILIGVNNNVDCLAAGDSNSVVIGTHAAINSLGSHTINIEAVWKATGTSTPATSATTIAGTLAEAGITSDATHVDATVCEDTTSHIFFFGSGAAGICLGTSSLRFKQNVAPLAVGLDEIMALDTIVYNYKPGYGDPSRRLYGFAAEQVENVMPELVGLDTVGRPNSVDWAGIVPVLVRAVQQEQREIEALQRRVR